MLELSSPLPPEECLRRLRAASDPWWKIFGSKPAIGSVLGGLFWGCRRISYRNSWQTVAYARVRAATDGSHIIVRFGLDPFVFVLTVIWFGVACLAAAGLCLHGVIRLSSDAASVGNWMIVLAPLAFLGLAFGQLAFCRWLARNEKAFLTEFLMGTMSASKVRER